MECNVNNDIPVKIPSFPYVLLNWSVLCNCEIKAENYFPYKSLAAYQDTKYKLIMRFMVNTPFNNYFDNLADSLKFPTLLNWTTYKQTLLISLQSFDFDPDLLKSSKMLKDFVHQFHIKKEILDFWKRCNINDIQLTKKNSFINNHTVEVFLFVTAIISLLVTSTVLFIISIQTKLKSLVTNLALQQYMQ